MPSSTLSSLAVALSLCLALTLTLTLLALDLLRVALLLPLIQQLLLPLRLLLALL